MDDQTGIKLARAYVVIQRYNKRYSPEVALIEVPFSQIYIFLTIKGDEYRSFLASDYSFKIKSKRKMMHIT